MRQFAGTYLSLAAASTAHTHVIALGGIVPPARAAPPELGVRVSTMPLAAAVYVIVITPVASVTPTEVTIGVAGGAPQPVLSRVTPLEAFSATVTLAESARLRPSVTLARTK